MYTNKKIWGIAYPIMFSLLAENIIGITDTAFLGRVGEVELGGAALGGVLYLVFFMLGFGFSTGSQILIARRNGEERYSKIASIFIQGNAFLFLLAILLIWISLTFTDPLLKYIINSEDVHRATSSYLKWRVFGLLVAYPAVMFRAFYVGITRTKVLTVCSVLLAVINIFLDYVLVFGKFGLPAMGIEGAALASTISEGVFLLLFIAYTSKKINLRIYGFYEKASYNMKELAHILNISCWTMLQLFLALATWFIFFIATEHLGERQLAISNMVRSVSSLMFMVVSAYATTANTIVSNMMGEGVTTQIMPQVKKIFRQELLFLLPIMALMALFPTVVLGIYSGDESLVKAAVPSLMVLVSCYFFAAPGMLLFQFISGTGNTRSAFGIECIVLTAYMIFVWLVAFRWQMPVYMCWFSEHVYWVMMLVCSWLYIKNADWQSKKI